MDTGFPYGENCLERPVRRAKAFSRLLCCSVVVAALPCPGQSRPSTPHAKPIDAKADREPEVPLHALDFKVGEPVAGLTASPIVVTPVQCSTDGTLFLDMLNPSDPREHTVYAVQDKKSQKFSVAAIPDLHNLQVISFFPTDSMVSFLVRATRETALTPMSQRGTNGEARTVQVNGGDQHYFVAKFDRDGQYKESIELAIDYPLFRMAVLPSGEFLVTGYDQPNNTQRLMLLDAGGTVVRPLDLSSLAQRGEKKPGPNESQDYLMAKSVASIEFVARGESVLMWKRGTNDPVFELRAGGSVREVPIAAPIGYVLSDLVPSDDVWLAHFRPSSVSDDAAYDSNLALYYEVMPLDGSLLRRLVSKSGQPSQIACKSKGIYLSYETDEKSRLVEMVAR